MKCKCFPYGSVGKSPPAMDDTQEMGVRSLSQEDPLEEETQPTSVFLPENLMDRGARQATVHGVAKSQTQPSTLQHEVQRAR